MTEEVGVGGRGYRGLFVFRKARELASDVINVTGTFPKSETFSTVSQMRRAALSIASNIAEGARRGSTPDFIRFLRISYGSCGELGAQVLVCRDAGWIDQADFDRLDKMIDDVSGLVWRLMEGVKRKKRS